MEHVYVHIDHLNKAHPKAARITALLTKCLPPLVIVIYAGELLGLFVTKSPQLAQVVLRPLIGLVLVTLLRKLINRPRPFEHLDADSLIDHEEGTSFPSRHAFSAMVIALVSFRVHTFLGIVLLILALVIALTRVLSLVHHVSDVIAGLVIAAVCALV